MWSFNQGDNNQNSNVGWNTNNANPAGGVKVRFPQHMFSYQLVSSRWLRQQHSGLWMELGRSISCSANANAPTALAVALQRKISARKRLKWFRCRRSILRQRRWCCELRTLHCQMGELFIFIVFRFPWFIHVLALTVASKTLLSSLSAQTQAQLRHRRAVKSPSDSCTQPMPASLKPCTLLSRFFYSRFLHEKRKISSLFLIDFLPKSAELQCLVSTWLRCEKIF